MQTKLGAIIVFLLAAGACAAQDAKSDEPKDSKSRADELFRDATFAEAGKAYAALLTADPANGHAALRLGEIALMSNRLADAERNLQRASELLPGDSRAMAMLAEAHYRQDQFPRAAELFRRVGRTAMADKLQSFEGRAPYRIRGSDGSWRVPFIHTDPLPVIEARVNGTEPVNFIIDTGGGELILDPEFGQRIGAARFGSDSGTFAGGNKATYEHARVDSLQIGDLVVEDVPVELLSTQAFAAAARGKRVDGVLGTVFLYHFLATLDYPKGELLLRRRGGDGAEPRPSEAGVIEIPMWMAGDHFVLARGRANQSEPCLMLVDTGLAGGGFTCPESTIKAAGVKLPEQQFEGVGGGGTVKVTPFVVDELSLGEARQSNIISFFGPFPASLEHRHGFRIGGLVSHSFFRPYAVTFDFGNMRLYLRPGR